MNASLNRTRLIAAAALACAAAAPAFAGDFMVRARALYLEPANEGTYIAEDVSVNSKYIWEVDASYFVTPNVALELIATSPQRQTVSLGGNKIGTLRHLPPTLTLQYHFAPENPTARPYVGFGVNYTRFSAQKMEAAGGTVTLDKSSRGVAFQVGCDFPITKDISFNVDFKKINIRAEAHHSSLGNIGTVKIDPTVFGVGIGYRF
ncbi:MAG: OmpW family outer membrane protein [Aquabacterium sp.]